MICCSPEQSAPKRLQVSTSILPQKYFLEKLGFGLIDVSVLVPPGTSPHTYEPRPSQMAQLARAQVYFATGIEFEDAWLSRLTSDNPGLLVVHCDSGIPKIPVTGRIEREVLGLPPEKDGHEHIRLDPHVWLSPELVKIQVLTMAKALGSADTARRRQYMENYRMFLKEIDTLQTNIRGILANDSGKTFMVFHPSWGYFAKEFHLNQVAIEVEGKEPSVRELKAILNFARKENINTIFIQPQFSDRSARIIASTLTAKVAVANDLAYDWGNNLLTFAKEVR